jgi:L-ascorbate metabolism protein UlaG (beta-lactamase superfamily)
VQRRPKRWVAPGIAFEQLPPVDIVLQSHNHYDHLDDATVRRLSRAHSNATWVLPLDLGSFVRKRGVRGEVIELDWWEERTLGPLQVAATPAMHFSSRGIGDRGDTLWCGFALRESGNRRVYFAGDTGFHPEFGAIGERYGPFDVALLPIGAYEPRWFMRYVHMNPEEAVEAFRAVNARTMVPIHWGTFKLTDEAMDEPPARARAAGRRRVCRSTGIVSSRTANARHVGGWHDRLWIVELSLVAGRAGHPVPRLGPSSAPVFETPARGADRGSGRERLERPGRRGHRIAVAVPAHQHDESARQRDRGGALVG